MGGASTSVASVGHSADRPSPTGPSDHLAVLGRIQGPRDLQGLSRDELTRLADAIRAFLIEKVSVSGGARMTMCSRGFTVGDRSML